MKKTYALPLNHAYNTIIDVFKYTLILAIYMTINVLEKSLNEIFVKSSARRRSTKINFLLHINYFPLYHTQDLNILMMSW